MLENAQLIGTRYQLVEQIGKGGMGTVYQAVDRLTGQTVALKRVVVAGEKLAFASEDESHNFRLALAREFGTLASLRHPNIISVLDYGFDTDRQPFFTLELLREAQPIVRYGRQEPLVRQIELLVQMLQALAYLHRRGIVHRDLKPDNVMVVNDQVKVLDFGLAVAREHIRDTTGVTGTIAYMAPEVLREEPTSETADLYAVGVMAYELFGGKHPFHTESLSVLLQEVLFTPPDTESLPIEDSLKPIVSKLLAKDPRQRPGTADEAIRMFTDTGYAPAHSESISIRESYLQAARFVGRESEMSRLLASLDELFDGKGSAWLIGGESGVGKSRLMDEVRTQALINGVLVLRGQAISEGGSPYILWREALRLLALQVTITDDDASILKSLVPDLSALLGRDIPDTPPQTPPERLIIAIEELVSAQPGRLLFLMEDLHWADSESLTLLKRLQALPVLLIATYRDDEAPNLPAQLPGLQTLKLRRLPRESIAALSESMLGAAGGAPQLVDLLERETEGNIFFMVEVMRALAEHAGQLAQIADMTLPRQVFAGGIQVVIRRRLARVPELAMPLLKLAAVAGRWLDLAVLRTVDADLDTHLTQCADAVVLEIVDDTWRFAHDKLREGLLLDLNAGEKIGLHRRTGTAIEQVYPDNPSQAAALAYHWGIVGDLAREARYSIQAGDHAFKLFAYSDAVRYYQRAIALPADADAENLIYLYLRYGRALELNSRFDEALQNYETLESLALARNDLKMQSAAVAQLALIRTVNTPLHNMEFAMPLIERGLALAIQADDPKSEVDLLWAQVIASDHYGNLSATQAAGEKAITLARQHGFRERLSYLLLDMGRGLRLNGALEKGNAYASEAVDLFRELGNLPMLVDILVQNGWVEMLSGDTEACLRLTGESMDICRQIENTWNLSYANAIRIGALFLMGLWDEVSTASQEAIFYGEQSGFGVAKPYALSELANVYREYGDASGALSLHHQAFTIASETTVFLKGGIAAQLALDYFALGDAENGQRWTQTAREISLVGDIGFTLQVSSMLAAIARNADSNGQWAEALPFIGELLQTTRERRLIVYVPDGLFAEGDCLLGLGKMDAAEAKFIEALHAAPDRPTMWTIHAALARLYCQQGQIEKCAEQAAFAWEKARFIADHVTEPTRFMALARAEIEG